MTFGLNELKAIRKRLGLSQAELANKAGVSQSLIAKIESGNIDPTYSKATRIIETLQDLGRRKEIKAKDIMNTKVVFLRPHDSIKAAISKMKNLEISQLPIIDGKAVTGFVSEGSIMEAVVNGKTKQTVQHLSKEVPPVIPLNSLISVVSGLLKHYPLVLVSDTGNIKGIITKSDLITKIY